MTDHCGLKYLFDQPRLNARQARWMALISEFDFEIKHIKGKENKVVDTLSRSVQTIHLATTSVGESNIQQRIKTLLSEDEFFNQVKEKLQQEPKEKRYEGYQLRDDNLLMYNKRLYVPNSADLRQLIMDEFHRRPYVGHPGYQKMVTTVRKLYYWPGMKQDIAHYISKCLECQQVKVEHRHPAGLLQPIQIPEWKWEVISMDFITGFTKDSQTT
jgi:hypothetical protein